jgi:glutaminyl-tRNA synthetase
MPDFIREMVAEDVAAGKFGRPVATRFPPEPNGFPHIGHLKPLTLNFGIAHEFDGRCNLRFDDTNPATEDVRYVDAIKRDIEWLGFAWDAELYASDYFGKLYEFGELLVNKGKAYVDSQNAEEIRENRGTVTTAGTPSPYRERSVGENLDLLRRMKAGEFPDGAHVLRAKIDMSHPNMIMRDPILLRVRHAHHYRQGDAWCLYPLYDFAHPLSDAIEGITPGRDASAAVQAPPGTQCSIVYIVPSGGRSTAQGLVPKVADSAGRITWTWLISGDTGRGTGSVRVTCGAQEISAAITIG